MPDQPKKRVLLIRSKAKRRQEETEKDGAKAPDADASVAKDDEGIARTADGRFRKGGTSPNKSGRPKRDREDYFDKSRRFLDVELNITDESGKKKKVTREDILTQKEFYRAIEGNAAARKYWLSILEKLSSQTTCKGDDDAEISSETDQAIIAAYEQEIRDRIAAEEAARVEPDDERDG